MLILENARLSEFRSDHEIIIIIIWLRKHFPVGQPVEDIFEKHATTGRLVYVSGVLQTRRWRKDGEESDRFSTEIRLAPGGRVQFLEKPKGATATNGSATSDAPTEAAQAPAATQDSDEIPF